MFVKLNERVYLNMAKITRMKIDHVEDGIRVRFYEGQEQVAKSKRFKEVQEAEKWLNDILEKVN
ncbi:sodium-dependent tyrosine transporter [Arcobacter sp. CECT 8985]|uniref:sodium-dependent tyrosine transporter n=1 Tax=Arcobacter sp. CECT 8985 TaxID=1935424 RepID=UPI00100B20DE|nr:sodium-dependent tyrosine transporter [Arcobacter sp. CECT 8985]RXJ88243.1 sodium-dependent tyrosine transporter [Arcobacter sp. CECT 8985]